MDPRRTDIHVRNGALAASMRFGPLRVVCVRPAPKSRFASSEMFAQEDQEQIEGFPAKAGPTDRMHIHCRSALARDGILSATQVPQTHRNSRASALLQNIFITPKDFL
ncbi:hypothetical protein OKW98_11160 [Pseudomonas sp. KU26590]|uniref:hypothetical protein n=1 Tax=Pseudomonas sp. KU26590 TaxID=2991051 RepID=UPI00223E3918|nr:hypothetical protein [Pseudomonas sp. KU26590]UZJ62225.1 hypothetical protein OKW98_11160 [Pseudomonas sp. KU26590]